MVLFCVAVETEVVLRFDEALFRVAMSQIFWFSWEVRVDFNDLESVMLCCEVARPMVLFHIGCNNVFLRALPFAKSQAM